ncbi:hypothetical protein C0216_00060 [Streptomyces globosus]|uniref:Uncharacterized protein n=2 Tax=Streptomyces globosus TaxID=68209 RepID=A0A344TTS6_9ACTN|nr:hypothetical protein C0216_00060 [Streptomyces globosus]
MGVMGRLSRTLPAVAAALGLAAGLPGTAYAAGEPLPAYRTADGARPVQGAESSADAPALEPGAVYGDTLAPGSRFYRLNLDDTSSVYVSAVLVPKPGARIDSGGDGLEVSLMTTAGRSCPGSPGRTTFGYGLGARPIGAAAVRLLQEDGDCQQAGVYYVKVTREASRNSDRSPWPVELTVSREPGLKTGSAPAAAPSGWPSTPPQPPASEPVAREGGTGFNDARALGTGVWRDGLRPGQTRFYRVPLDWGQQLSVGAELAAARLTKDFASASTGLGVTLYTPYRSVVDDKDTGYDGRQAGLTLPPTAPVAYENRFAKGSGAGGARVAGWYYLAVTLGEKVGEFTEDAVPVPLTLRLTVQGKAAAPPPYAEGLARSGFGVDDADRAAAREGLTQPEAAQAADRRATMGTVAAGGFGTGTLLLLVLGGWLLLARRGRTG